MFILGLITGLLLALFVLAGEIFLKGRNREGFTDKTIDRVIKRIEQKKGKIILPKSEALRSAEEKIQENERRGIPTNIDEIAD